MCFFVFLCLPMLDLTEEQPVSQRMGSIFLTSNPFLLSFGYFKIFVSSFFVWSLLFILFFFLFFFVIFTIAFGCGLSLF